MVVAIGLSLLDCYADPRISFGANARDRTEQFTKLFDLVYDGFREVQAIDLFGQNNWSMLYSHLLTRRALIENERNNCDSHFAVTFAAQSTHSLTSMLKDVAGLSEIFFKGLSDLKHNNIAVDRIASALREAQIDLPMLVDRAKELNEIDARRPWLIEDASIIAERLAS